MTSSEEKGRSVSAVVINYNGASKLRETVTSICLQSVPIQNVIVVDNGSTDGSIDSIMYIDRRIEILSMGENAGLTRARNAGLKAAKSEFVLLCDNDVSPAPDALSHLMCTAEKEDAALVCPRIIYHPERDTIQTDGAENHYLGIMSMRRPDTPRAGAKSEVVPVNSAIGACYLMNREKVLDCGGFDERYFFYFEDLEFALRIRASAHRIMFDSNAVVYHDRGTGTPELSYRGVGNYPRLRAELSMRNRLLTMVLHFQRRTLVLLSPALIVYEVTILFYCLFRGWLPDWFRSWRWIHKNRKEILERRYHLERVRKIGDKQLLSGGPIPFSKGFLRGPTQKLLAGVLSTTLNGYWVLVRRLLRD